MWYSPMGTSALLSAVEMSNIYIFYKCGQDRRQEGRSSEELKMKSMHKLRQQC